MTSITPDSSDIDARRRSAGWHRILRRVGLVYVFSRLCVLVGAAIVAAELRADENLRLAELPDAPWADPHYAEKVISSNALEPVLDVLTSWDGNWYLEIVRHGYPRHVPPNVTYEMLEARAAFFPLYPISVRVLDFIVPGGQVTAALLLNVVLGGLFLFVVGLIAREVFDIDVAERSMILMALFPGSFVLSFAYTEALLLVLAAGCLLLLMRRQWLLAGLLAALGTATRPNGLALVAACAVAAFLAIKERREWRSLVAVLLAPVGFIAFQWWVGWHAGEPGVWFRVQTEAWGEGASFGVTAITNTFEAFTHPLTSPTDTITAASVVTMVVLIFFAYRERLPWPMLAYTAGVLGLMLLPSTVTARPRFLYTAFPLLIAAAAWFRGADRQAWWPYVLAACSAGLVGLTALYGVLGAIP
ncbi:MAG: mannosyltransferase family protein [Ilumatobacteraceae bacterium]